MWRPPQRIQFEAKHGRIPSRAEAEASRLFSPVAVGPVALEQRTWVPAMVPWRATEDGFVTDAVIEWYARFAKGRPGAIVVEATGIRDIPSGPLMRIGDDRFIPGLQRLVEAVREASDGHSRLFIQLIDFLSIRRRPDAKKYFERFLAITDAHRAALPGLSDADIRAALAGMKRDELCENPDRARTGVAGIRLSRARHRHGPAAYPRPAAGAARPVRRCRPARAGSRLRRRRTALRPCLYDGLVPLAQEHARRRLWRFAGKPRAAAARSVPRGPRADAAGLRGRLPLPRRRMHRRRQRRRRRGLFRRAIREGRDGFHLDLARRQVRRRQAAGRRRRGLSLYGAERLRMHAAIHLRRTRTVRPQCRCHRRDPQGDPCRRSADADRLHRRRAQFRIRRADAGRRRLRHRRLGAPDARRSRLVPEDEARPRRQRARLRVHQLLRRPRPEAQDRHLPALGQGGARRSEGEHAPPTASAASPRRTGRRRHDRARSRSAKSACATVCRSSATSFRPRQRSR